MKSRRFFVGIELDDATRAACEDVARRLQATGFEARYERPEKYHVTLAFLGNVEPSHAGAIGNALDAAMECGAFDLVLDRLGAFPHERSPRVVFIGSRAQGTAFRTLADAVRASYAGLGFEFAADAVAHVSIARVREHRRPLPAVEVAPIVVRAGAVALFESFPDAENRTSRYEIVKRAALAGV